jgi:replicative DNA helicase
VTETRETLERAVLSALVYAPTEDAVEAVGLLGPTAFTKGSHRCLYEVLAAMVHDGRERDLVTVTDELELSGWTAEDLGGWDYLLSVVGEQVTYEPAARLAASLAEQTRRAHVADTLTRLAARATDRTVPLDELVGTGVDELLASGPSDAGLVTVDAVYEQVRQLWAAGLPAGARTGWEDLDRLYRVARGQWTLVTGIPGHGKSTLLDALLVNLAAAEGWRFLLFSPENSPVARHVAKLAACYQGARFSPDGMPQDRMDRAVSWVSEHFRWIDPADATSLRAILSRVQAAAATGPMDGFVIDPWNEVEHVGTQDATETTYISRALSALRRCARKADAHAWLVAHPTKLRKNEDGTYPVPTPYDVSGSANWRNKADMALAVYRDVADEEELTEVHVQKVRYSENGRVGVCRLSFRPEQNRYYPYSSREARP